MAFRDHKEVPLVINERDCDLEEWSDEVRGKVQWRTLLSGDRTSTSGLTCGVAELPVGSPESVTLHQHDPVEVYYILEGNGVLTIDGIEYEVSTGSTAYIPGNTLHGLMNTGVSPLRLLYIFPVDSFRDVEYVFPDEPG